MAVEQLALTVSKSLVGPLSKRVPDLLLGKKSERELIQCVAHALRTAVDELELPEDDCAQLYTILGECFSRPATEISTDRWSPVDGSLTVLITSQVEERVSALADPELTGVGRSSLDLLNVDPEALSTSIGRQLIGEIARVGVDTGSSLHLLAAVLRDEAQHSDLIAALARIDLKVTVPAPQPEDGDIGVVSLVARDLVVPDGTPSAVIRLAVTNTGRGQQRLCRLIVTVAERRPSEKVRLRLPGAPLQEYELKVDLREAASVDALAEASHQFILLPGDSEAFRLIATFAEGTRYKLVIHPEFESLVSRAVVAGRADHLVVDFPIQSVESLRRAGRMP